MIEGRSEIAQHEVVVQDGQLMIFIPGAEGGSEPLSQLVVEKLKFIASIAEAALAQEVNRA